MYSSNTPQRFAAAILILSLIGLVLAFSFSFSAESASASTTDGTIDSTNKWAWSENAGWIDFGTSGGTVHVTDSALTGYAYGENIGWISLNCSNTSSCTDNSYAVANNGEGTLSGYAWSENAGWINFAPAAGGVTISSSGVFSGYAYSENLGWIVFATDHAATTDWRLASTRAGEPAPSGGGSSGSSVSNRVHNLIAMGKYQEAQALMDKYPQLFPSFPSPTPGAPTNIPSKAYFLRDLQLHDTGEDVRQLQMFLNESGFLLAEEGPGSPGQETGYFGLATWGMLARFQEAHGIEPPAGFFGPLTRGYITSNY